MNVQKSQGNLDRLGDILRLAPQIVSLFYPDFNRLGQRPNDPAPVDLAKPDHRPERWIGSSTPAVALVSAPEAGTDSKPGSQPGLSLCPDMGQKPLKEILADPELGPRLLGEERFTRHQGMFRLLVKLLDAGCPIPLHVHANDAFLSKNPETYPNEQFGKDEAYHFLETPKGGCPYVHLGLYPGVDAKTLITAMRKGIDHVLELSPAVAQKFGEGYMVQAGLLHRPGTALTLEVQQPSAIGTMFQYDLTPGRPLPAELLHPGFDTLEDAAEAVIEWDLNTNPKLLTQSHLVPSDASGFSQKGGKTQWVFPPGASTKFSGLKITVESQMTLKVKQPLILFVWRGQGTLNGRPIDGRGGPAGQSDEFFIGVNAGKKGLELVNSTDTPLVIFALFGQSI